MTRRPSRAAGLKRPSFKDFLRNPLSWLLAVYAMRGLPFTLLPA
ncbi:MAG: hypothetical protein WD040_08225 [Anaerolineales bacterium]